MKLFDRAMAGLGVTRLSRVLVALGVVAVLAATAGVFAGIRWERGTQAIATVDERDRQLEALQQAALDLRDRGVENTAAYRAAADRMGGIAAQLERDRDENRQFVDQQRSALADLLAKRPDLRDVDVGVDVMQHWNRSNQGPRARSGTAPAGPAGKPANAVPGASAPAVVRPPGAAVEPRPGDGAVSRLQGTEREPAAGRGRVGADGVGLVLPRAGADRRTAAWLPADAEGTGPARAMTNR
ncbi:MAG: hypothetical protein MK141_14215 [Pseudoxanthomonas sp.]|uniref:hypothetical protein n=1 Tax=Pseudoxanthomonas sp. TaxID=1871049 RepID=UPI0025836CA9|nr:hypothetical protein [Pseudoxanthomonas sp.]MCH2092714.1 hypothetical protein [Pseudoxanthomonas sp.]